MTSYEGLLRKSGFRPKSYIKFSVKIEEIGPTIAKNKSEITPLIMPIILIVVNLQHYMRK